MSILGSLYSAVSGLGAHSKAIEVVSDNIANVNTVGFKAARGRFEDVLGDTVASSSGGSTVGRGSRMAGVEQLFTQGALLGTGVSTDLAIEGDGFFIVRGVTQGISGNFFSRAGQFHIDTAGRLVDPQGLIVQGYMADAGGTLGTSLTDVSVRANAVIAPNPTANVVIAANLNSDATVLPAFNVNDAGATSNFSTSVTIYDSLGASHIIDVFFRMDAPGQWAWYAITDGGELTGGTPDTPALVASGTLTFTTDGALDTETTIGSTVDFVGATPAQSLDFDFGTSVTTDGGTGRDGLTNYAGESAVSVLRQDGFGAGELVGIAVGQDGTIQGAFTNGERRTVGRLALARFRNQLGLARAGAGLMADTLQSGPPLIGAAATGGRGSIAAGSLEQSNVDLAREFVNLISIQRGFQATSRTVSTADEMLLELVNLKR